MFVAFKCHLLHSANVVLLQAQYHVHTSETLDAMDKALDDFHAVKDVFVNLGVRKHFNTIPKLHSLLHYTASIRLLGTADGYNTEASERLHIDYAKDAYRASNKRDYVSQMTTWLRRQETVQRYAAYLQWRASEPEVTLGTHSSEEGTMNESLETNNFPVGTKRKRSSSEKTHKPPKRNQGGRCVFSIADKAAFPNVPAARIISDYQATNFVADVASYLKKACPTLPSQKMPTVLDRFDVFRQMKIYLPGARETGNREVKDRVGCAASASARPGSAAKPARFDTVLVEKPDVNEHTAGTSLAGAPS